MARSAIVSAVRTPFGKLGGGLASYQAPELGAIAIAAAHRSARHVILETRISIPFCFATCDWSY